MSKSPIILPDPENKEVLQRSGWLKDVVDHGESEGDKLISEISFAKEGSTEIIDRFLSGDEPDRDLLDLTDRGRLARAVPYSPENGARVAFVTNLGTLLTYPNPPEPNATGTVVKVRTSSGDTTAVDGRVFVKWDNGEFSAVQHDHLRPAPPTKVATTTTFQIRTANLGDLSEFLRVGGTESDLVHKATKDLWAFRMDGDEYVIERLFDADGDPLKV